ncbi:MAG: rod shape-determining protein MreD [Peptococcaceae bacterium BRH_c4b]|nr:MAG: rod shape-determining protein MreD [Peptococcaceae bacterium BRH_c4b]
MRLLFLVAMIVVSLIVQSAFLDSFHIWGIKPDLVLVLVVYNAFLRGHREGAFVGFCGGMIQDIYTGSYIGLNALSYMTVGYLVGMTEAKLYKDSSLIMMALVWFASAGEQFLYYLLMTYTGVTISPLVALVRVIVPTAAYTALLVPLTYKRFYSSNQKGLLRGREV